MKHTTSRMLFSYWDALRGERSAPERGEIQPGAIRQILADTFILEVGADRRAQVRLAGTRCCALFGGELKGRPLASLWPERAASEPSHLVETVTEDMAGVVAGMRGVTPLGAAIEMELLMLPLRHRGKTYTRILGSLSPATIPTWLGIHALECMSTTSMRVIWPSPRLAAVPPATVVTPLERRQQFVVHLGGRA